MYKTTVWIIALLVLGTGTIFATHQDQQEKIEKNTTLFMQHKLDHARDIVSGLATEDFKLIGKNAQDLMLLSHEADWKVITTAEYLRMSSDFRGSAQRLRDSANSKNLDGATLAYFEVTLNCVRCHKYIRKDHPETK